MRNVTGPTSDFCATNNAKSTKQKLVGMVYWMLESSAKTYGVAAIAMHQLSFGVVKKILKIVNSNARLKGAK